MHSNNSTRFHGNPEEEVFKMNHSPWSWEKVGRSLGGEACGQCSLGDISESKSVESPKCESCSLCEYWQDLGGEETASRSLYRGLPRSLRVQSGVVHLLSLRGVLRSSEWKALVLGPLRLLVVSVFSPAHREGESSWSAGTPFDSV